MASSTPPPHCTLTTAKPYQTPHHQLQTFQNRQNHQNRRPNPNHKVSLNRPPQTPAARNAAKPSPSSTTTLPRNPNFPSISSLPPSKSELATDFTGRRSTRFVSKMHFGRPKTAGSSRHTSTAEEALQQAIRCRGDDRCIESLLLSFESKLCGSDDYTYLLRELGNRGEWSMAIRCFEFAVSRERRRNDQGKLASSMISILGRLGKVDLAKKVFEAAVSGGYGNTVYAYSALISAYAKSGFCDEAIRVFEIMKSSGLKPNLVTYNALIDACGKGGADFKRASEIFDEMLRNGVQPDRITYNSLLAVCSGAGLWDTARHLFGEMVYRGIDQDIYTYNTLLDAACSAGHMEVAFEIMSDMPAKNILPNEVTYSTMIRGCAKAGRLDRALSLFNEMKYAGINLDRVSYNTLLAIYASLGRFEEALNVGKEMESIGIKKDVVTYNALLDGFGKQGMYDKVKELFEKMKADNLSPNLLTYSTLISVYSKGGLYREAVEVYREFKQEGLKADVVFYSKLIDALCKKGLVESSALLLDEMTRKGIQPNVVTYNSIINAFGQSVAGEFAGDGEPQIGSSPFMAIKDGAENKVEDREEDRIIKIFEQLAAEKSCHTKTDNRYKQEVLCVLGVFQKMHELEIKPNVVTFSAILNACSRCSSFEEASLLLEELRLFDNQVYGVAHGLLMGDSETATHALDGTTVISLLQPDPETYELFDDIILLSEGQIIYQGPRGAALEFFESMGFRCPNRKNVADFLQEVTSEKDQEQYWFLDEYYQYVPVAKFVEAFRSFSLGSCLSKELAVPFDRRYNHPAALSTNTYGVNRIKLLKISFLWQLLLLKRNSFVYFFKFFQLLLIILIMTSVFFRTTMHHNTLDDGGVYLGALYFAIVMILFNGFMEVPMLIAKLPVLYKHRDLRLYPCWVFTLPSWLLSIPSSLVESAIWVGATYYAVGFDPEISRCLRQLLLYFSLHQMSIALFRIMASLGRNMIVANTFGSFAMLVVMALGGFILSRDSIPSWWIWGYWFSPLMYAQNAASVNEFLGNSWDKKAGNQTNLSLGEMLLKVRSLSPESYWYWIGVGALFGYTILFNILFTFFLTYLNPLGKQQVVISKADFKDKDKIRKKESTVIEFREYLQHSHSFAGKSIKNQRGMVLPFQPLSMAFSNISYYVDVPLELRQQGITEDRLQLLVNVTGAFRPGVLTALVGVSGAGKTTLMDVLAGRKTGGYIKGGIYISGYPKRQETFARVSGYCEQNDVHSPCLTVRESLLFSSSLRLPSNVNSKTQRDFVDEVMELVELTPLSGALVGLPGVDGLSTEQRKRLTIAVELVANPSIVFMDEPTSGLDARAAAIVMRTVRNIVNTGRTIVCTIHQPSVDIFESFDELLLMKRGGELIFAGPLGNRSHKLIQFFERVEGVPKIRRGYNPAAWILEVTSPSEEIRLGLDFAEIYRGSDLFQQNKELVESLSKPDSDSNDLNFPTKYSQPFFSQFLACLWKQSLSYWRNPQYTAVRFFYTVIISLMFGTICWKFGSKRETQQDIFNAMGSMYAAVLFIGITNASSVQPVVYVERSVSYRERAAGMYSALPFAFAQVAIEFPYVFIQSLIYSAIFYFLASFEWNVVKFVWYIYFMYFTLLYFTFFGMVTIAVTPNHNIAAIVAAPFYMMWNLFSGFMIARTRIPIWWRWYYWANPIAWSLYGLLTSQYGDINELVKLADGVQSVPVKKLLEDQFGYRQDFLVAAVIAVVGFCLVFAVSFAFAMKSFNFQRR